MNQNIRNATLSAASREVMRPLALNVAQKILHGKLYDSTALSLFNQALNVLVYQRDEDHPPPDGWEDYYQDCLDLIQSYQGVIPADTAASQDARVERILRGLPGQSSMDVVRSLVSLETSFSSIHSRMRKQGA